MEAGFVLPEYEEGGGVVCPSQECGGVLFAGVWKAGRGVRGGGVIVWTGEAWPICSVGSMNEGRGSLFAATSTDAQTPQASPTPPTLKPHRVQG